MSGRNSLEYRRHSCCSKYYSGRTPCGYRLFLHCLPESNLLIRSIPYWYYSSFCLGYILFRYAVYWLNCRNPYWRACKRRSGRRCGW